MKIGDWPPLNLPFLLSMWPRMRKASRPRSSLVRVGAHRFKTGEVIYLTRDGDGYYYARVVRGEGDTWLSWKATLWNALLALKSYYLHRVGCGHDSPTTPAETG